MKRELLALKERLLAIKRLLENRRTDAFFTIWLIFFSAFAALASRDTNPGEENYQLIQKHFIAAECSGTGKELIFNFFYYDDVRTWLNLDLAICIDQNGQLVYVIRIDEDGHWNYQNSLPVDFPIDKIPEIVRKSPKLPQERDQERPSPPHDQIAGLPQEPLFLYPSLQKITLQVII